MSIRGVVILECDSKGCHAEEQLEAENGDTNDDGNALALVLSANDWRMDEDGLLHCPQCCHEGRERNEDDGKTYGHPADAKEDRYGD